MTDNANNPQPGEPQPVTKQRRPWWWRVLGIRRREGRFLHHVPTRWGWVLMILVVLLVSFAGFAEYSMQPDFCRSCHIMEPYFQAWHNSTHRDVPCADCHFEPGFRNTIKGKWEASSQAVKFLTGTYGSKPHAEVRDASCLREGCHANRLLEGKVNWTTQTHQGHPITIKFDHKPHLTELRRGKQLRCVSCHSQMVQGQHIVVTLDTCFLCHFKGMKHGRNDETLGGCRSCHDAPKQEIRLTTGTFNHADYLDRGVACERCHADAVKGDGAVPRQVCWNCHNKPQHIAKYGETNLMHKTHVTDNKVECAACHVDIVHQLNARAIDAGMPNSMSHGLADSGTCGRCHEQSHVGPLDLYRGTGGRGVPDMPSAMYRAQVDCLGCHQVKQHTADEAQVTGQTFLAAQEACDQCHGNKYGDMVQVWKNLVNDQLTEAGAACARAAQSLAKSDLTGVGRLELDRLLDDAKHNVKLVRLGHGVHNITYANALLSVSLENCDRIEQALGTESQP